MCSQRITKIFIALLTMISISPALGGRATLQDAPNSTAIVDNLKHLCSQTVESIRCWKIIEPQLSKFKSVDRKAVAAVVIDLAETRGKEIREQLKQLQRASKDEGLKAKYAACSTTYSTVISSLVQAERWLASNNFKKLTITIFDIVEQSESCRYEFEGIKFDPAHFKDRVKEFGVYVNIVKVAVDVLPNALA